MTLKCSCGNPNAGPGDGNVDICFVCKNLVKEIQVKIAISGHLQAGKDTAADYFISRVGGDRAKFADKLYEMMYAVQDLLGLPKEKDRRFLQINGTEWGRHKDPDMWVKQFMKSYAISHRNLFCTDARFPNEFRLLHQMGFILIKVERPLKERMRAELMRQLSGKFRLWPAIKTLWTMWRQSRHESEQHVDKFKDWDYVLRNDGTIAEFHEKLEQILSSRYALSKLSKEKLEVTLESPVGTM